MNIPTNTQMAEMAGRECERLQAINTELLEALQAVADLANGQGQLNLSMVAGQARSAIAKAQEEAS